MELIWTDFTQEDFKNGILHNTQFTTGKNLYNIQLSEDQIYSLENVLTCKITTMTGELWIGFEASNSPAWWCLTDREPSDNAEYGEITFTFNNNIKSIKTKSVNTVPILRKARAVSLDSDGGQSEDGNFVSVKNVREINRSIDARTLYNFTQNSTSENFTIQKGVLVITKDDVGSSPGSEALQGGGDSVINDCLPSDLSQAPGFDAAKTFLNMYGGMVRSNRFLVNNKYNYGYSLVSTRQSSGQQNGNYIYDNSTGTPNTPRTALNTTYMFNYKNQLYYPVYIYCGNNRNSVSVSGSTVTADGKTYQLNANDKLICYERELKYSTTQKFIYDANHYGTSSSEGCIPMAGYNTSSGYSVYLKGGKEDKDMGPFYCHTYTSIKVYNVTASGYSELTSGDLYNIAQQVIPSSATTSTIKISGNNEATGQLQGDFTPFGSAKKYSTLGSATATKTDGSRSRKAFKIKFTHGRHRLCFKDSNDNTVNLEPGFTASELSGTISTTNVDAHTGSFSSNGVQGSATFSLNAALVHHGNHRPLGEQQGYYGDMCQHPRSRMKLSPKDYSDYEDGQDGYAPTIDYAYREGPDTGHPYRLGFRIRKSKGSEDYDGIGVDDEIGVNNTYSSSDFPHKDQYIIGKAIL